MLKIPRVATDVLFGMLLTLGVVPVLYLLMFGMRASR